MYINGRKLLSVFVLMFVELFGMVAITDECSFQFMSIVSVLQLIINMLFVSVETNSGRLSFASIFLFLSWFFHCGQIVKIGFNIPGFVPLDVTRYAGNYEIIQSFKFYYLTQLMVTSGMLIFSSRTLKKEKQVEVNSIFDAQKTARWLWIIGIVPRLYIDIVVLINGFTNGYKGVYNLVIPQMVQTLAFFFDVGCIVALMDKRDRKKSSILFWTVLVYKCITMSTGARQEKVAFLIIWILIYYFIVNEIKIGNLITLVVLTFVGVLLINAIGNIRTSGDISFTSIIENLSPGSDSSIFGNMLGEFGSALTTLAVTIRNVPSQVSFGYGDAYLAGVLSIVPTLASRVGLGNASAYVSKFQGSTYFGGSYIGELYYNFSWLGIVGGLIIGCVIISAQSNLYKSKNDKLSLQSVFSAVLLISMYLFVRGYFTDMVQRLTWIWILMKIINNKKIITRKSSI